MTDGRAVVVEVRDTDARPLVNAAVRYCEWPEDQRPPFGNGMPATTAPPVLTDEAGRATLELPIGTLAQTFIGVSLDGFQPLTQRIVVQSDTPVAVVLQAAGLLRGRVVSTDGTPVPGARVFASVAGRGLAPDPGSDHARALSLHHEVDSLGDGSFEIVRFHASALLQLSASHEGFELDGVLVDGAPASSVHAQPGKEIRVVLRPMRQGVFRMLSARTGEPILDNIQQLQPHGRPVQHFGVSQRGPAWGMANRGDDPSYVYWKAAAEPDDGGKVEFMLIVAGYKMTLVLAEAEEQPGGKVLTVLLVEKVQVPTGTLLVTLPVELASTDAPVLSVKVEEGGQAEGSYTPSTMRIGGQSVSVKAAVPKRFLVGDRVDERKWVFRNVPAGRRAVSLRIPLHGSVDLQLDLPKGGRQEIEVPELTRRGVRVRFVNAQGQRLFEVPHWFESVDRPASRSFSFDHRARVARHQIARDEDGTLLPPPIYDKLWPGKWRVNANLPGVGSGSAEFSFAGSEVTDVEVVIR